MHVNARSYVVSLAGRLRWQARSRVPAGRFGTGWCLAAALALLMLGVGPLMGPADPSGRWGFAALADDDDGGGGGGGGGGGAASPGGGRDASEGGGGRETWAPRVGSGRFWIFGQRAKPRQRVRQTRQTRQVRRVRQAPRPVAQPARPAPREYVVLSASSAAADALVQARFVIVKRQALAGQPGEILRLRAPAGLGRNTALRRINAAAPGTVSAENDLFRGPLRTSGTRRAGAGTAGVGKRFDTQIACASGAVIGMVDTAVDLTHPALAGTQVTVVGARSDDRRPASSRHGTAVASLLMGQSVVPGLVPGARLIAVDAFHRQGNGESADTFDLARALDMLLASEAKTVNLSLTGPDNPVVKAVIERMLAKGQLVVAAAGNDGPRAKPLFPAAYDGVVAVAAIQSDGQPWRRSARGPHISFAADGVDLALAGRDGAVEPYSGTSFAAPVVTAMLAAQLQKLTASRTGAPVAPSPAVSAASPVTARKAVAARDRLVGLAKDSGAPGRDEIYGHGIVQPANACS